MKRGNEEPFTEPPMPDGMNKNQQMIFEAFRSSSLGREGKLQEIFFSRVLDDFKDMINREILQEIPTTITFSTLPNHPYYGIAGEEYPENHKNWQWFRDTGHSWTMRYCEFKKVKFDRDKVAKDSIEAFRFIQEEIAEGVELNGGRIVGGPNIINDYTKNKFEAAVSIRQYVYEIGSVEGAVDQFLAEWTTKEFFDLPHRDEPRKARILELRLKHIKMELAKLESEVS